MELVTCVIPTYKRTDMLTRAIDSALGQSYPEIEVLVVDDNIPNSDESNEVKRIVNNYHDDRVRYIGQEVHVNGARARNEGIKNALGKYVAFLDDDDEWESRKIEVQLKYLCNNANLGGVTCLYSVFQNGKVVRRCLPYKEENLQFKVLTRQVSMYTSTFLAKKEILMKIGGFNEKLNRNQDLQLFTDFLAISSIKPVQEYLVNLYEDSNINRTGIQRSVDAKETFLEVEKEIISKYSKPDQKRIYGANYFEIVVNGLRSHDYKVAFKYITRIAFSPKVYMDVLMRYKKKKESFVNVE